MKVAKFQELLTAFAASKESAGDAKAAEALRSFSVALEPVAAETVKQAARSFPKNRS